MPLLSVKDLTVAFAGRTILDGVTLALGTAERVGLAGPSGSGKSLLAACTLGLQPPAATVTGEAYWSPADQDAAVDLLALSQRERRRIRGRQIGLVFQEPTSSLNPLQRVGRQVAEAVRSLQPSLTNTLRSAATRQLFEAVQLGAQYERVVGSYPHQLSGGQRQRVLIAIALAGNPRLLIADEATTALDPRTETEILDLIDQLVRERGMASLLITHDENILRTRTDRIVRIHGGKVVSQATVGQVVEAGGRRQATAEENEADVTLRIAGLNVAYPGRGWGYRPTTEPTAVLRGLSLSLRPGEWVALVGPSGVGKTTLARFIVGQVAGEFESFTYAGGRPQLIPQDPAGSLNPKHTVERILLEVLRAQGYPQQRRGGRVGELLAAVRLPADEYLGRLPGALSGGQRQRVAIARALAAGPTVLVADESVSALDADVRREILQLFTHLLQSQRVSLLFITHDRRLCDRYADRTLALVDGRLVLENF